MLRDRWSAYCVCDCPWDMALWKLLWSSCICVLVDFLVPDPDFVLVPVLFGSCTPLCFPGWGNLSLCVSLPLSHVFSYVCMHIPLCEYGCMPVEEAIGCLPPPLSPYIPDCISNGNLELTDLASLGSYLGLETPCLCLWSSRITGVSLYLLGGCM